MWPGYGDHMGWMGVWWFVGLAVLLLLVWVVARAAGPPGSGRTDESPETILKRRYARGDIDREEFDRRLTDLRK
jgi:putative membrane protein